jgi:hypothetical protein
MPSIVDVMNVYICDDGPTGAAMFGIHMAERTFELIGHALVILYFYIIKD